MTMREVRGTRRLPLPALLLLPLLGAPVLAMNDDSGTPPYTSPGEVRAAQSALQSDHLLKPGYYTPGIMDQRTVDAVREFQRDHSIPQSGSLDHETMSQLTSHGQGMVIAGPAETTSGTPVAARRRSDATSSATAGAPTASPAGPGGTGAGTRSMPRTAGLAPLMAVLGTVLLLGGLLLARRRRA